MAETLGLVASAIQVAGAGLKLSQTLYQYADSVASADRRIRDVAKEIQLTTFVIEELGTLFKQDATSTLLSTNALTTANETIRACSNVFTEINTALKKAKKNTLGRLMLPFRDAKIELLRSHLDKLKSTLQLLLQVLAHAHQVAAQKLDREAETAQREEIRTLLQNKRKSTKRYEESLKNYSMSEDSTVPDEENTDENGHTLSTASTMVMSAALTKPNITVKTLANCVQHIERLLSEVEILQQVLEEQEDGADHSEDCQSLIGSYFRAREQLDSALLGTSSGVEAGDVATKPGKERRVGGKEQRKEAQPEQEEIVEMDREDRTPTPTVQPEHRVPFTKPISPNSVVLFSTSAKRYIQVPVMELNDYYQEYGCYPPGYSLQQQPSHEVAAPPYGQPAGPTQGQISTTWHTFDQPLTTRPGARRPRSPRTWKCELPDCTTTATFTRLADLQRHQSTAHGVGAPDFPCTVKDCTRVGEHGFTRRDHLVEHLRNFHHLDVPKRRPGERSAYPLGLPQYELDVQEFPNSGKEVVLDSKDGDVGEDFDFDPSLGVEGRADGVNGDLAEEGEQKRATDWDGEVDELLREWTTLM